VDHRLFGQLDESLDVELLCGRIEGAAALAGGDLPLDGRR